jgi:hypothetical protein
MNQLSIYCSRDLTERVIATLDRAGVTGFLQVREATGNRFQEAGQLPRTLTWEATLIVVPVVEENRITGIVQELEKYANQCDIRPCLHVVVSPVVQVI